MALVVLRTSGTARRETIAALFSRMPARSSSVSKSAGDTRKREPSAVRVNPAAMSFSTNREGLEVFIISPFIVWHRTARILSVRCVRPPGVYRHTGRFGRPYIRRPIPSVSDAFGRFGRFQKCNKIAGYCDKPLFYKGFFHFCKSVAI